MNHAIYTARILFVALIAPLLLTGIALIVAFTIAAGLPARVAVHWDLSGHANGYGSPYAFPIGIAAVCLPLIAIFGGVVVLNSHRGPLTPLSKLLAVSSVWVTLMVCITFLGVLLVRDAGAHPGASIAIAFGVATVVAAGAWFALPPGVRGVGGTARPAIVPVALAPGERASWIRTTSASRAFIWTIAGVSVLEGVAMVIVIVSSGAEYWAFSFVPLLVIIILLSNFAFTVRVDARGVLVRSVVGIPFIRIPLDQVTSADVIDVRALSEYGGWGIRWALNGRLGVIVRSGEALEVHREKGLDLVVTVDDASTAAALLNGLVKRGGPALL